MSYSNNSLPFESRYKKYRILNFGKPYTNYRSYNVKYHPENKTNILAIYVDNQVCNNVATNKSSNIINMNNEKQQLLNKLKEPNTSDNTKIEYKYYVEIHYTLEQHKPKLEYIMAQSDINELLSKYGYIMEENDE
jgi:hypothetical protein